MLIASQAKIMGYGARRHAMRRARETQSWLASRRVKLLTLFRFGCAGNLPPGGRISNPFLLRQLAQRVHVVERSDDLPFQAAAVGALHYHYQFSRQPDSSAGFFGSQQDASALAQRRTGAAIRH
jgi:hypothetical protein